MRIYLTVTPATWEASLGCEADAWIVDLGRGEVGAYGIRLDEMAQGSGPTLIYRVAGPAEAAVAGLLAGATLPRPAAILVPAEHGRDIAQAGATLAVHEAEQDWPDGATRIVALVTSAAGALNLASFAHASKRLAGIGWDAAALADDLGMDSAQGRGPDSPLAQVRSLVRLAAGAARVEAIESACPASVDLRRHAQRARRDGFGVVFAQSTDDVAVIRSF